MTQIHYFLALVLWSLWVAVALSCATDEDCSLNGLCLRDFCHCDHGWIGLSCGKLDLRPAKRYTGYNHTTPNLNFTGRPSDLDWSEGQQFKQWGNSSWGGNIIQDRDDEGLFHLVFDMFGHGCGLSGWRPGSFIARAESRTGPEGKF